MSRHTGRELDRLRECNRCGGTNTTEILSNDDENIYQYTYFGWCRDCFDGYNYSLRVDTIHDREDRI